MKKPVSFSKSVQVCFNGTAELGRFIFPIEPHCKINHVLHKDLCQVKRMETSYGLFTWDILPKFPGKKL